MATPVNRKVVDISHWNTITSWPSIKAAGVIGVIHKATEGAAYKDVNYLQRAAPAYKNGFLWGAYHFGNNSNVQQQVALQIIHAGEPRLSETHMFRLDRGRFENELFRRARERAPRLLTKSGIILGLGEERQELLDTMRDLRLVDVNVLTLGQYLRPSAGHLPVALYYRPEEFADLKRSIAESGKVNVPICITDAVSPLSTRGAAFRSLSPTKSASRTEGARRSARPR
jgi:hypothetical protein